MPYLGHRQHSLLFYVMAGNFYYDVPVRAHVWLHALLIDQIRLSLSAHYVRCNRMIHLRCRCALFYGSIEPETRVFFSFACLELHLYAAPLQEYFFLSGDYPYTTTIGYCRLKPKPQVWRPPDRISVLLVIVHQKWLFTSNKSLLCPRPCGLCVRIESVDTMWHQPPAFEITKLHVSIKWLSWSHD